MRSSEAQSNSGLLFPGAHHNDEAEEHSYDRETRESIREERMGVGRASRSLPPGADTKNRRSSV